MLKNLFFQVTNSCLEDLEMFGNFTADRKLTKSRRNAGNRSSQQKLFLANLTFGAVFSNHVYYTVNMMQLTTTWVAVPQKVG